MKSAWKIAVVALLVAGVAATVALRERKRSGGAPPVPAVDATPSRSPSPAVVAAPAAEPAAMPVPAPQPGQPATAPAGGAAFAGPGAPLGRPRLVELGSVRCNACKEMMKVLDALRASQGKRLQVDFIDVFENPAMGDQFGLKMIPTQILYDAQGKELFRHIGFFSHDEILAKFREHGVKL